MQYREVVIWLFVAHFILLIVSVFYIQLACLQMASLVLVPVAKRSPICFGSHTKCTMLYLVFLKNQPLLFDILMQSSLNMIVV